MSFNIENHHIIDISEMINEWNRRFAIARMFVYNEKKASRGLLASTAFAAGLLTSLVSLIIFSHYYG